MKIQSSLIFLLLTTTIASAQNSMGLKNTFRIGRTTNDIEFSDALKSIRYGSSLGSGFSYVWVIPNDTANNHFQTGGYLIGYTRKINNRFLMDIAVNILDGKNNSVFIFKGNYDPYKLTGYNVPLSVYYSFLKEKHWINFKLGAGFSYANFVLNQYDYTELTNGSITNTAFKRTNISALSFIMCSQMDFRIFKGLRVGVSAYIVAVPSTGGHQINIGDFHLQYSFL